jgi:hypothetical protein
VKTRKIIRNSIKIGIGILSLALTITSFVGLYSTVLILLPTNGEYNIVPDWTQAELTINKTNSRMYLPLTFDNKGFYNMSQFNVTLGIEMINRTSNESFSITNKTMPTVNINPKTKQIIIIDTVAEDFTLGAFEADMNYTWPNYTTSEYILAALNFTYTIRLNVYIEAFYTLDLIRLVMQFTYNDAASLFA